MKQNKTLQMVLCALFAALIAVGAFIRIPLPYLPITLQTLFVTLAGLILGPKLGMASALVYTVLGLIGIPIFTQGGGIGYVLQPSFGYILGFSAGAYMTGAVAHRSAAPSFLRLLGAGFAGLSVIYALGAVYFWMISVYYLGKAITPRMLLTICFFTTVPGDALLTFLAALAAKRLLPVSGKMLGYSAKEPQ